ncbi:MAG: histidine kinase [Eubacteriales bacterium]|nr:histidine kinase [Eubacteriales bacterium]
MRYFQDVGLLIMLCMLSLIFTQADGAFVFSFLLCVSFCCFCYVADSRLLPCFLGIAYAAAACFFQSLLFFFPPAVYALLYVHPYIPLLCAGGLYLWRLKALLGISGSFFWFEVFGLVLAFVLWRNASAFERLSKESVKMQDDSREHSLLLAERNKTLLANQDYEIYTATLKERNRIAREIHDNVGHILSRSILMVGALKVVGGEEAIRPMLENLDASLNSAMDSIRSSVHDLHEESIDLEQSIRSLIRGFSFCSADLEYDMGTELPPEVKYCFISITKEALSNIMRHSNAQHVQILMREHPALYQLCIEDNGTRLKRNAGGLGLTNMQERVQTLGGNIQITASRGFRIFITVPKK